MCKSGIYSIKKNKNRTKKSRQQTTTVDREKKYENGEAVKIRTKWSMKRRKWCRKSIEYVHLCRAFRNAHRHTHHRQIANRIGIGIALKTMMIFSFTLSSNSFNSGTNVHRLCQWMIGWFCCSWWCFIFLACLLASFLLRFANVTCTHQYCRSKRMIPRRRRRRGCLKWIFELKYRQ